MITVKKTIDKRLALQEMLLCVLLMVCVFGAFLAPADPTLTSLVEAFRAPSWSHPFGTDHLGRCVLSRVLYGARVSVFSAVVIVVLAAAIGSLLGVLAGYWGGAVDSAIFRLVVLFQTFPSFLLAVAVAGVLGNGLQNGILAMVLVLWTSYARMSRSLVVGIRNSNYVFAARLMGAPSPALLYRHIFPNTIPVLVVKATQDVGNTILSMSALSFLGLGAGSSTPEWGVMISVARQCLDRAPWCLLFPGLALFVAVIIFNGFGDALRRKYEIHG